MTGQNIPLVSEWRKLCWVLSVHHHLGSRSLLMFYHHPRQFWGIIVTVILFLLLSDESQDGHLTINSAAIFADYLHLIYSCSCYRNPTTSFQNRFSTGEFLFLTFPYNWTVINTFLALCIMFSLNITRICLNKCKWQVANMLLLSIWIKFTETKNICLPVFFSSKKCNLTIQHPVWLQRY